MTQVVNARIMSCAAVVALVSSGAAHAQTGQGVASTAPDPTAPATSPASPAQSQTEARSSEDAGLGEILVTARRFAENLQTVPVSVTAIGANDLAARGIANIAQVAQATPSLSVNPGPASPNSAVVSIRGQVQSDTLITLDPSVGVYVDDVYYARAYAILTDLLDVSDVQVLKGPQGTLYGRNTIGGAIKVETQKPDPDGDFGGYMKGGYGNYNAVDLTSAINAPLVAGKLAIRYAFSYHDHDGYTRSYLVAEPNLTPVRTIRTDDQNNLSHRLSLRFTPSDRFTLDASGSLFYSKSNGGLAVGLVGDIQRFQLPPGTPSNTTTQVYSVSPQRQNSFYAGLTDAVPRAETNVKAASVQAAYELSDKITAKAIVGYVKSFNNSLTNGDGTVTDTLQFLDFSPVFIQRQRQYSGEFQLLGKAFGGRLDWLTGIYIFDEKGSESTAGTANAILGVPSIIDFAGKASNKSKSAFANLIFSLTDSLRLNGGLRYTKDTKSIDGQSRDVSAGNMCVYSPGPGVITSTTPNGPCSFRRTDKFDYWTYEVGLDYKITDSVFVYAKTGNGYRGGGQQIRAIGGQSIEPFSPDKVVNYEAGFKTELFGRRLRLNGAYYHTDFSNTQQTIVLSPPAYQTITTIVQNSGDAKIDGGELEATLRLGGLVLGGGVSYTDFRYDNPALVQSMSPKWIYNGSATYTVHSGFGDIVGRVDYAHADAYHYGTDATRPDNKTGEYNLLNARLSVQPTEALELAIWGKNLTKDEYYRGGVQAGYTPGLFYGVRSAFVGAPRTYGVEATFRY